MGAFYDVWHHLPIARNLNHDIALVTVLSLPANNQMSYTLIGRSPFQTIMQIKLVVNF